MDVKKKTIPVKILIVIGALAVVASCIWLLGFLLSQYQNAWEFILGAWGGFGSKLPAGYRIWSYAGGLLLMLLSGFFFPTVMDRLNLLPIPRLVTPVKVLYAVVSIVLLAGAAMLALGSLPDNFDLWGLAQLAGLFIGFSLAVKLWCRK
jgi:hypothetical protein